MRFWTLIADADVLETLIRIGIVVLFMLGPYLLQLLGGKAVQDDRGKPAPRRRRQPQTDLEREIAEFLEQSRGQGKPTPANAADDYVEAEEVEDLPVAEVARQIEEEQVDQVRQAAEERPIAPLPESVELQPYLEQPIGSTTDNYRYEEAPIYNYDAVAPTSVSPSSPSIAAMLRDPANVRNAFVLGEIITRPQFPRRP